MITMKTLYNQMRIHPEFRDYVYDWLDKQSTKGIVVHEMSRKTLLWLSNNWRGFVGLRRLSALERDMRRYGVDGLTLENVYEAVGRRSGPSYKGNDLDVTMAIARANDSRVAFEAAYAAKMPQLKILPLKRTV
jgi:hypothetical protein